MNPHDFIGELLKVLFESDDVIFDICQISTATFDFGFQVFSLRSKLIRDDFHDVGRVIHFGHGQFRVASS